ncbi:MAG: RNA polymerase sigma factor [Phycisphaerales bacterium]
MARSTPPSRLVEPGWRLRGGEGRGRDGDGDGDGDGGGHDGWWAVAWTTLSGHLRDWGFRTVEMADGGRRDEASADRGALAASAGGGPSVGGVAGDAAGDRAGNRASGLTGDLADGLAGGGAEIHGGGGAGGHGGNHGGGPGDRPSPDAARDDLLRTIAADWRVLWSIAAGVLGDAADAEDVLQDAILVALERLDGYEVGTNCTAWLARIVRFTALNRLRRRRRRAALGGDSIQSVPHAASTAEEAGEWLTDGAGELHRDQRAFDDETVRALRTLDPRARACLLLRVTRGMSYRELGRVMDMPEGTVMSHVHRARSVLRVMLQAEESGR